MLSLHRMQPHHSSLVWMLHSRSLRLCCFQIRDIITNKDKQADDLFHRQLIFITEEKEVCQHISQPWNFVAYNAVCLVRWQNTVLRSLQALAKCFLNSLISYEKQWFMRVNCTIGINLFFSLQIDVTFMQMNVIIILADELTKCWKYT